jgi:hypothetical protein
LRSTRTSVQPRASRRKNALLGLAQEGSEGLTAATRARTNASAWAGKGIGAATRRSVVVTGEPMDAAPPEVLSKRAQSTT